MQTSEKLVMMVNQIVRNLAVQGDERAVAVAADHMHKFWEPRMRAQIYQHVDAGGEGLTPLALRAVRELERLETPAAAS
jgi:formate dehydrogenase subunit delta